MTAQTILMKFTMKTKINYWLLLFTIVFQSFIGLAQENKSNGWTQFRGAERAGVSTESLSHIDFSKSQPELVWKKTIGSGFSEITVTDGIVYTMISEIVDSITGYEYLAAFSEETGEEIWRTKVDSIYFDEDGWGDGARATPCIDEKYIFTLSGHGKLTANLKKDGSFVWQHDFKKEFGSTTPRWGFASSPLIVNGNVIMEVGGTEERAFMAFNKVNGDIVWSSSVGPSSHDSPLLANIEGQEQIVFANGRTLYSLLPEGDTLWTYSMPFGGATAIPVFIPPNKLFLSAVRNPGFFIVKVENNKATELLKGVSMKNDFSSCIYHDGYIYGFHVAAVRCISAETGEVKWTKRGYGKGSLILVDDKLIILSDKGKLVVADASPDAYKENCSIQAIDGKSWTAPSFYNGKVYVRNLTEMASYKLID